AARLAGSAATGPGAAAAAAGAVRPAAVPAAAAAAPGAVFQLAGAGAGRAGLGAGRLAAGGAPPVSAALPACADGAELARGRRADPTALHLPTGGGPGEPRVVIFTAGAEAVGRQRFAGSKWGR